MAIIQCTNCGHIVSDQARACPKCGTLVSEMLIQKQEEVTENFEGSTALEPTEGKKSSTAKILIILAVFIAIVVGLWLFISKDKDSATETTTIITEDTQSAIGEQEAYEDSIKEIVAEATAYATETTEPQTERESYNYAHYSWVGTIGSCEVYMELDIENGNATGFYHYNSQKYGHNLSLTGQYYEDGTLELYETTPKGTTSGHFVGKIHKDFRSTYSGTFYNLTNGTTFSFSLTN